MPSVRKVPFLCVQNSVRSQIAEGFGRLHGKGWEARSAGSKPPGFIHPRALQVVAERGADTSGQRSKSVSSLGTARYGLAVGMGRGGAACPTAPGARFLQWDIPDPKEMDLEGFRKARDLLEEKVKELFKGEG